MEKECLVLILTVLPYFFKYKFSKEKANLKLKMFHCFHFFFKIKFHQNPHHFVRRKKKKSCLDHPNVWLKPWFSGENSFGNSFSSSSLVFFVVCQIHSSIFLSLFHFHFLLLWFFPLPTSPLKKFLFLLTGETARMTLSHLKDHPLCWANLSLLDYIVLAFSKML